MNNIKEQIDYKIMIDCINKILEKKPISGSIILGKKYAKFYLEEINKMLEFGDRDILEMLTKKVEPDLEFIRKDCANRIYNEDVQDNNNMMSIILDFILTLN
jgi:hypothetical protein